MALVVDASITMAWCFLDEATAHTWAILDRVRDAGAIVPAIWPLEVANALLVGERRGRLTEAETTHAAELLRILPFETDPVPLARVFGPVLGLGRAHRLSAYDASYLELAMREGLPLATRDARLSEAAIRVGVPLAE